MIPENKIILFPLGENISFKQKEFVLKKFSDISLTELDEYFKNPLSEDEIFDLCEKIEDDEKRLDLFKQAKEICEIKEITICQLERLALLGEALMIEEKDTGFDFSLYDESQCKDYIFQLTLIRFAMMSTVVEIIPLNKIISCFAASSLQTALATKVAEIYNFKLDVNHFLKMASGSTGVSLLFKGVGYGISRLFPFNFIWRASSAFASAYAVGLAAKAYIGAEGKINADNLKSIWESSLEEGKSVFRQFKNYIYRNKISLAEDLKKWLSNKDTKEA